MIVESSGTQTAVLTTEHTLATTSTPKTRVLIVDANALASGETLLLQIKGNVLSGGTERLIKASTYVGVQTEPHIQSPPFVLPQTGTITLTQTGGTGRAYPWAVISLD